MLLRRHGARSVRRPSAPTLTVWAATTVALVVGAGLRAWFLFHLPLSSDQAVVGLMAKQILHGHATAFYWGQAYGGVEPYLAAGMFAVGSHSALTLNLVATMLAAVAALLVWRITLRVVHDRRLAVLAGALAWAAPLPAVYKSTIEYGFRGVTLASGLAIVLVTLRILDHRDGIRDFVLLGLLVGIGWWSAPEIVYFFIPAVMLLVGAVVQSDRAVVPWLRRFAAGALALVVGALPWLWSNVQSGLASLDSSKFPGSAAPLNTGYRGRLGIIFRYALPVQLDLRPLQLGLGRPTGKWIFGSSPGIAHDLLAALFALVAVAIVVAIAVCLLRGGRSVAIGAALIAFPFLAALQPGTWYWQDGRYLVYVGPLLAIAFAVACKETRGIRNVAAPAMSVVVVASVVLTLVAFHQSSGVSASSFFDRWGHVDRPTETAIASLRTQGVRAAYADYWVAYKIDFLSHDTIATTVTSTDADRSRALDHRVERSRRPAWLFVPPSQLDAGLVQFGATQSIQGPGGIAESAFVSKLRELGVAYRVVKAGLLEAVIPERPVTVNEVGPTRETP